MQEVREALAEIVRLTDDQSYSHAARMVEIKRHAAQAISDLEKFLVERKSRPTPKVTDGGKTGNPLKESDQTAPEPPTPQLLAQNPAGGYKRDT